MMIWSCDSYESHVTGLSTRGVGGMTHDEIKEPQDINDVTLVWITIESHDSLSDVSEATKIIQEAYLDLGRKYLNIIPFAHLSNDLIEAEFAKTILDSITDELRSTFGESILREHFGSDKEVELILKGHPGNIRYREITH